MNAKFMMAGALFAGLTPILLAALLADMTRSGVIKAVAAIITLGGVWTLAGFDAFKVCMVSIVAFDLIWRFAEPAYAARFSGRRQPPEVTDETDMRNWCRRFLRQSHWKIVRVGGGGTNLTVSKDGKTVHLLCIGSTTTLLPSLYSDLGKSVRGTGAPVILIVPGVPSPDMIARAEEGGFLVAQWTDLERLASFSRPIAPVRSVQNRMVGAI
jgi:hypothetical protein